MKNAMMWGLVLLVCAGCVSQDEVLFSTGTTFGFEAQAAEGGGSGVTLGYKRQEFVSMPMRDEEGTVMPAFSTLALFNFESNGFRLDDLGEHRLQQLFATGTAAEESVSSGSAEEAFRALRNELPPGELVARQREIQKLVRVADASNHAAMLVVVGEELARGVDLTDAAAVRKLIEKRYSDPDERADAIDDLVTHGAPTDVVFELVDWAVLDGRRRELDRLEQRLEDITR